MINVANVSSAAAMLSTDAVLLSNGVLVTQAAGKATMSAMVKGAWSLLYQEAHRFFMLPMEVQEYVKTEIDKALTDHCTVPHMGEGSSPASWYGAECMLPVLDPTTWAGTITKKTRGVQVQVANQLPLPGDSSPDIEIPVPIPIPVGICTYPEYIAVNALMV